MNAETLVNLTNYQDERTQWRLAVMNREEVLHQYRDAYLDACEDLRVSALMQQRLFAAASVFCLLWLGTLATFLAFAPWRAS